MPGTKLKCPCEMNSIIMEFNQKPTILNSFLTQIWSEDVSAICRDTQWEMQNGVNHKAIRGSGGDLGGTEERSLYTYGFCYACLCGSRVGRGVGGFVVQDCLSLSLSVSQGIYSPATWMKTEGWTRRKRSEIRRGTKHRTHSKTVFLCYQNQNWNQVKCVKMYSDLFCLWSGVKQHVAVVYI